MEAPFWFQVVCYAFFPLTLLFIVVIYTLYVIKYATTAPMHLRWELYPVPHEKEWKYGGSYLEELEWWTKPRKKNLIREISGVVKDYLFFTEYFKRNRGLWYFLLPLHIGFYSIVGLHILFFFSALFMLAGLPISAETPSIIGKGIYWLTLLVGVVGFAIGVIGCIGVFLKRLLDKDLRLYSSFLNYFSPLLYLSVLGSGLYAWYFFDPTFSGFREFMKSLITFTFAAPIDVATGVHIILFGLMLIYMPFFTPALHYATKFITYFGIRWDDEPNLPGSKFERKFEREIPKILNQRLDWSAPHIQTGKKWSEVVTEVKFPPKSEAK